MEKMDTNPNDFAFPCYDTLNAVKEPGLSKKEVLTALIYAVMLGTERHPHAYIDVAIKADKAADVLFKVLNQ